MKRTAVLMLSLAALTGCRRRAQPPDPPQATEALQPRQPAQAGAPRCKPSSARAPFVLSASNGRGLGTDKSAEADGGETEERSAVLPFAAETGAGIAWSGGFALGAIHAPQGSPVLAIVVLGPQGENPSVIPLGAARGDVEPPRITALGDALYFGVLQPELNGRTLRIGMVRGQNVLWGASLPSRAGESQAFDIAAGEKVVAVWDEERPDTSVIQLATIDPANIGTATTPRTISPPGKDADSPRLVPRPGGYWLAWIAHIGAEPNSDAPYMPEDVGYRWIQLVPLDPNGSPTGKPRDISAPDGHVVVFDLGPTPDGGVLVVWRDLDTPTGSPGGKVMRVVAHPASVEPPAVLIESDVGTGAPTLAGRWLAITDAADITRLAPVSPGGELMEPPLPEPDVGTGEPIAARDDTLLISRPAGRDTRLSLVECHLSERADR